MPPTPLSVVRTAQYCWFTVIKLIAPILTSLTCEVSSCQSNNRKRYSQPSLGDNVIDLELMAQVPSKPPLRGLKDKVAIATGARCDGDGIGNGRAILIMLADEGCHVLCLDLR